MLRAHLAPKIQYTLQRAGNAGLEVTVQDADEPGGGQRCSRLRRRFASRGRTGTRRDPRRTPEFQRVDKPVVAVVSQPLSALPSEE